MAAFATSYIPSSASQVTRAADSASMIGNNFARWYNVNEGSIYVEGLTQNNVDAGTGATAQNVAPLVGLGDGLNNQFRLDRADGSTRQFQAAMVFRTAVQALIVIIPEDNTYPPLVSTKMAAAMKAYDYALSSQGSAVETTSVPDGVIQGPLLIGQSPFASGQNQRLNGTIKRIAYYPRRLANTELTAITS